MRPLRDLRWIGLLATIVAALAFPSTAAARLPLDATFGPVSGNPVLALDRLPLDDYRYDRATHCVKRETKGSLALVKWLPRVSKLGQNWGIIRCEKWGKNSASLHAEGRAVDWHLRTSNRAERAEAERLIRMLVAPDGEGRPFALARRLGVQGLIWDCRAWWGGDSLRRYSPCLSKSGRWKRRVNVTIAHRDHIHLELNKAGAKLQTSWWTKGPGTSSAPPASNPPQPSTAADDSGSTPDGTGGATLG